ncbi:MAG TPA: UrcA family protein [Steroidobacteraceae bacterium]
MITISTGVRGLVATAIISAVATIFAPISGAADSSGALQTTVRFSDLNVSTPEGAAVLYRRIRKASYQVCSPLDHGDSKFDGRLDVCVNKAIADAVTKANQLALSAVYNSRHLAPPPTILLSQQGR